jgi:hypothetical protein
MSGPRDLIRDKAERLDISGLGADMSGIRLWNLDKEPDKAGWDSAAKALGLGRTCPVQELDMSG